MPGKNTCTGAVSPCVNTAAGLTRLLACQLATIGSKQSYSGRSLPRTIRQVLFDIKVSHADHQSMNALIELFSLESSLPIVAALLLPPVPFLLLMLLGAFMLWRQYGLGWLFVVLACLGLWFAQCEVTGRVLSTLLLKQPAALSDEAMGALADEHRSTQRLGIAVLGAGTEPYAPEYGMSNLTPNSVERLRYGVWLSKRTGIPVGFSGSFMRDHRADGTPEASIAARIAEKEFGRKLQWTEIHARDTHENAIRSVALLREAGVRKIIVVTHGWHMTRALREFEEAARADIKIVAAPLGLSHGSQTGLRRWLPSAAGAQQVRSVLQERLGFLSGT